MFLSPLGYALIFGLLLQMPGLLAAGKRSFRLPLALAGAVLVLWVCVVRHDVLLFLAQLFLLPGVLLVYAGPSVFMTGGKRSADQDNGPVND